MVRASIEEQRSYYETAARQFDAGHAGNRANRCHRSKIVRIRQQLALTGGEHVLEVGTGTGLHAAWLLDMCPVHYMGVDISAEMLEIARSRLGNSVSLVESPAEELPFGPRSFDAVYCSGTLHHVSDAAGAIREMARVLKANGRAVICEPNPWNPINLSRWTTNRLERGQRDMRVGRLREWCERAGLSAEGADFFNFTPPVPRSFSCVFDAVDRWASKVRGLRRIASMVMITARKPG
ncbi:MAG: class I SAM-dependent methyltransferase [Planctomycetota bacterium]